MIIQLRGTSGSGKTTAMRKVKDALGGWAPVSAPGREKPLYYRQGRVVLLGHYESPCGGCDTVGSAVAVAKLIGDVLDADPDAVILAEGLLLSEDVKWTSGMTDVRVLFLNTDVEDCLRNIRTRREAAGNGKTLREENTRNRVLVIERARGRLKEAGVPVYTVSANQAPRVILNLVRQATR